MSEEPAFQDVEPVIPCRRGMWRVVRPLQTDISGMGAALPSGDQNES